MACSLPTAPFSCLISPSAVKTVLPQRSLPLTDFLPHCCRTCSAALEAVLPDGCARTVYLCDDGGDITKRKWVQSKAAEKNVSIVYISGRKRTPGEMNGKSANLNNCLRQVRHDPVLFVPLWQCKSGHSVSTRTLARKDAGPEQVWQSYTACQWPSRGA